MLGAFVALCVLPAMGERTPEKSPATTGWSYAVAQPPPSDAALVNKAIALLTAEARQGQKENRLPRQETTFAAEFLREHGRESVPGDLVWKRFERRTNRDAFIDAYVRWQLLGFNPAWPGDSIKDADLDRLIEELPALLPNPRTDRAFIARVNDAIRRQQVSDAEAQAIREADAALTRRASEINNLNRPALEIRRWLERSAGESTFRAHLMRLERVRALVSAGWNAEGPKRDILRRFEESKRHAELTDEHRARLAQAARSMIGLRAPIVTRVGIGNENAVEAQFDEAAVYDFEVNEWVRALAR